MLQLTRNCTVTDVERGSFHLRVDTSTLVAMLASKYSSVDLYSFHL